MCGIFAILNNLSIDKGYIENQFNKGKNRGPDDSWLMDLFVINCMLGFHRLAINGLNPQSNQPFYIHNIFLVCNGEIYNYKELYRLMGENMDADYNDLDSECIRTTDSDCEIIIHLYLKYGIDQTIKMLDGEFAFILIDTRLDTKKMFVGRDPYGVRPLYILEKQYKTATRDIIAFASEVKQIIGFQDAGYCISHFQPGTISCYEVTTIEYVSSEIWTLKYQTKYHQNLFSYSSLFARKVNYEFIFKNIHNHLLAAVAKRCCCTERPIACLLSGGLDSSLVTALVKKLEKNVDTYSIGFENSEDLVYAKKVSEYVGTNHHEIIMTKEEYLNAIPLVIQMIESYDTTTVRASVGNYLVAKYISQTSEAKVILNGDGSDELCGGYLYMRNCPDPIEFDKETRRLLRNIHYFDVLRSDKCISSNGLEARTPFLDLAFVQYYLSIDPSVRFPKDQMEKYILRKAFSGYNYLPEEILWRKKEAFSDGITTESIPKIINDYLVENFNHLNNDSQTLEEVYYKHIFEQHYPNTNIIPYYWKPKYINIDGHVDPSARLLFNT